MSRLAVDKIIGANTESIVDFSSITSLKLPKDRDWETYII